MKKYAQGFTLIELMVVIMIIAGLAAVATPTITKVIPNYQLKSAANDLVAAFRTARTKAIKYNVNVFFKFSDTGWVITVPGERPIEKKIADYGGGVRFGYPGRTANSWVFYKTGTASTGSDTITFNSQGLTMVGTDSVAFLVYLQNRLGYGYRVGIKPRSLSTKQNSTLIKVQQCGSKDTDGTTIDCTK